MTILAEDRATFLDPIHGECSVTVPGRIDAIGAH